MRSAEDCASKSLQMMKGDLAAEFQQRISRWSWLHHHHQDWSRRRQSRTSWWLPGTMSSTVRTSGPRRRCSNRDSLSTVQSGCWDTRITGSWSAQQNTWPEVLPATLCEHSQRQTRVLLSSRLTSPRESGSLIVVIFLSLVPEVILSCDWSEYLNTYLWLVRTDIWLWLGMYDTLWSNDAGSGIDSPLAR